MNNKLIKIAQPPWWQKIKQRLSGVGLRSEILQILNSTGGIVWEMSAPSGKPDALAYVSSEDLSGGGQPIFHFVLPALRQMVGDNPTDKELEAILEPIRDTLVHEFAHVEDFDPETGTFPGGEAVAEQAERSAPRLNLTTNNDVQNIRKTSYGLNGDTKMKNDLTKLAKRLENLGESELSSKLARIIKSAENVTGINPETGKTQTWYKSKPATLKEFNAYLAVLSDDLKIPQSLVDLKDLSPQDRGDPNAVMRKATIPGRWTKETGRVFAEYARLAGAPEAGKDWPKYARENGYFPNLRGIFDFWSKTVETVAPAAAEEETQRITEDLQFALSDEGEQLDMEYEADRELIQGIERDQSAKMAEHQRIYDDFANGSYERQQQHLSTRRNRDALAAAVSAVEGIESTDMIANTQAIARMKKDAPESALARMQRMQAERAATTGPADEALDSDALDMAHCASRSVVENLVKLSNHLDNIGQRSFANRIDEVLSVNSNQNKEATSNESTISKQASLETADMSSQEARIKSVADSLKNEFTSLGSFRHVRR